LFEFGKLVLDPAHVCDSVQSSRVVANGRNFGEFGIFWWVFDMNS
jgi:hypothetical protein